MASIRCSSHQLQVQTGCCHVPQGNVIRNSASGDNQNHYILTTATSLGELLSLANGAPTSSKSTKSKTAKSTRRISISGRM